MVKRVELTLQWATAGWSLWFLCPIIIGSLWSDGSKDSRSHDIESAAIQGGISEYEQFENIETSYVE